MQRQWAITLITLGACGLFYLGCGSSGSGDNDSATEGTTDEGTTDEGTATEGTTDEGTATEGTTDAGTATEGTTDEGTATVGDTSGDTSGDVVDPPADTGPDPEPTVNDSCGEALGCYGQCSANDPSCKPECLADLPVIEKQKFDDLISCANIAVATTCAGVPNTQECLVTACDTEFYGCIIGDGGDLDCAAFLECAEACTTSDDIAACEDTCILSVNMEGFFTYQTLLTCIYAACPTATGEVPDPSCSTASQTPPNGACFTKLQACACSSTDMPVFCASGECAATQEECATAGTTDSASGEAGAGKPGMSVQPTDCQMAVATQIQSKWFFLHLLDLR